jgi:hypothetical protein
MASGSTTEHAHSARGKPPFAQRAPSARSKLTNGTRGAVFPGVDQRSATARRYRDVIAAVIVDLGGLARITEVKLHLIRKFAALVVQTEAMESDLAKGEQINVMRYCKMSSTLLRLSGRIGIKRFDPSSYYDDEQQQDQEDAEDQDQGSPVLDLEPEPEPAPAPQGVSPGSRR